jgi:hypothetical protein
MILTFKKECTCLIHDGPHWLHMDAILKEQNHALLLQAERYEEAAMQSLSRREQNSWLNLMGTTLRYYVQAETSRLTAKKMELKRLEDAQR